MINDTKKFNGIAFAGCSFTWGQGLYYYSGLPTIIVPENANKYDQNLVSSAHYKYLETVRYPRLVSNHFETYELTQLFNGGSNNSIIDFWSNSIIDEPPPSWIETFRRGKYPQYNIKEVSHFVYQFTQWSRSKPSIIYKGHDFTDSQHMNLWLDHEIIFKEWLDVNNLSLDDYIEICIKTDLTYVKDFLVKLENWGINTSLLVWPHDLLPYVKSDQWLSDRLIDITHENISYGSIENIMTQKKMHIYQDTYNFKNPPYDMHPSLECHKIIATNVIDHLEKI